MRGTRRLVEAWAALHGRRRLDRVLTPDYIDATVTVLLDRAPTAAEREELLAVCGDLRDVLACVTKSAEYRSHRPLSNLLDPEDASHNRDTERYEELLGTSRWDDERIHATMAAADFPLHEDYYRDHRLRFGELFRFVDACDQQAPVRSIVEIGPTQYTAFFMRHLVPDAELWTIDRPVEQGGITEQWSKDAGAAQHSNIDLNEASLATLDPKPQADLVLCCEVLEHLFVDPTELLADLLSLVRPGGAVYLTTPNFLGLRSLREMERGRNPGSRFSRAAGNTDAHYHLREYTMSELEGAAADAGAVVDLAAFSDCWDAGDELVERWPNKSLRGNLVLVVRGGEQAGQPVAST